MKQFTIGIDVGTTHAKAIIMLPDGKVIWQLKKKIVPIQPSPGYHEIEADKVLSVVITLIKEAIDHVPQTDIQCICFSTAMHEIMAIDEKGIPLTNIITWADTRSKKEAEQIKKSSIADDLYIATGTPIHPMSPLCKLAWLQANKPTVFEKSYKFLSFKEYFFYQLTGKYIVDYSIAAATGLFNIHTFQWHDVSLALANISPDQLSIVQPPSHTELVTNKDYIHQLDLRHPIPFMLGGSDGVMANIGSGAVLPGVASLTIGTSAAIRIITGTPLPDHQQRLFCYAFDTTNFVCGGPLNNGGVVVKWFTEKILSKKFESENEFGLFIKESLDKNSVPSGILFMPHLLGERSIHWDAYAKASFIGLNASHTAAHMLQAVFEGIGFALYEILLTIEKNGNRITTIIAGGGFIASAEWVQLIADIFNKEIVVTDDADTSVKGAAIYGMHATGLINTLAAFQPGNVGNKIYKPDFQRHQQYKKYFLLYQSLYPSLSNTFLALDDLQEMNK